jgi:parvulin-like peptidyl-prolyl isomerase
MNKEDVVQQNIDQPLSFVANEDKQEDNMLSEISQTQKDKYCMFSHI